MTDVEQLLKQQAEWQQKRQALTWPEKIRMAERIRGASGNCAPRLAHRTRAAGDTMIDTYLK